MVRYRNVRAGIPKMRKRTAFRVRGAAGPNPQAFMRAVFVVATALVALAPPAEAVAEKSKTAKPAQVGYGDCMAVAKTDGKKGEALARGWLRATGGAAARHCLGTALMELRHYGDAALEFDLVARDMKSAPTADRVAVLTDAGHAWTAAGQAVRAIQSYTAALALDPKNADLMVDRAIARAVAEQFAPAADDLTRALALTPGRAEALLMRATAKRHLGENERALADLEQVLVLEPDNSQALLERGIVHQMMGADEAAREDWSRVVARDPNSAAAQMARRYLGDDTAAPSTPRK